MGPLLMGHLSHKPKKQTFTDLVQKSSPLPLFAGGFTEIERVRLHPLPIPSESPSPPPEMASYHHHQGHCHNNPPPSVTCFCYGGGASSYSSCSPPCHPCPSPPTATDPLLQSIASEILLRHQKPQPNHRGHHQSQQHQQTQFIISSLLQRIHALESSLHRFSSSSSSPSSAYDRASYSLRDMAARIIQSHFRSYLVRRSRTLRQLQHLALVKSSFISLKSSLPSDTHFDHQAFSQKTMNLLLKLDSIQACDPMIRVRKRAISRDLVRFLEFIEGVSVKRHGLSGKVMKNVRYAQNSKARALREQREMVEKLRDRVEKIHGFAKVSGNEEEDVELQGFHHISDDEEVEEPRVVNVKTSGILVQKHGAKPRVKKNVSFAGNGHIFPLSSNSTCDDEEEDDVCRDLVENLQADIGRIESRLENLSTGIVNHEEAGLDNEGSVQSSDEERNHKSLNNEDRNATGNKGRSGSLLFSAPLPVMMEGRDDSPSSKFVKGSRV